LEVGLNSKDLAIVEGEFAEVQELKASSSSLGFILTSVGFLTWFVCVVLCKSLMLQWAV